MRKTMIENSVHELNNLISEGKILKAFHTYYHDNVVMQENEAAPTIGKEANRQRELHSFGNISEFRKAEVMGMAVGENQSYVTWHFDYIHKEWGLRNYTQIAVQTWKDGKIIKEQFFYSL